MSGARRGRMNASLPTSLQPLGQSKVLVEFEYEPECLGYGDHPDESAQVNITGAYINGEFVGAESFAEWVVESWEAKIWEEVQSDADDAMEPEELELSL